MSQYAALKKYCQDHAVTLVAVSKTQPIDKIMKLYNEGQRIFGENKLQELIEKKEQLPNDIEWHLIGHLQSNKVKQAIQTASLIHSIDSLKLLECVEKEAAKLNQVAHILLQVKIAMEDTKFGQDEEALSLIMKEYSAGQFPHVRIKGLMGMASFVDDKQQIKSEFTTLRQWYDKYKTNSAYQPFDTLSMGMSGDYELAIECGSNMVRVGSLLFGVRH